MHYQIRVAKSGKKHECNIVHRNGTPGKSQWSISVGEEFELFELADEHHWTGDGRNYWSIKSNRQKPQPIGTRGEFIARFLPHREDTWHGFPGCPRERKGDRPINRVLNAWYEAQMISWSLRKKIARRQICTLYD